MLIVNIEILILLILIHVHYLYIQTNLCYLQSALHFYRVKISREYFITMFILKILFIRVMHTHFAFHYICQLCSLFRKITFERYVYVYSQSISIYVDVMKKKSNIVVVACIETARNMHFVYCLFQSTLRGDCTDYVDNTEQ